MLNSILNVVVFEDPARKEAPFELKIIVIIIGIGIFLLICGILALISKVNTKKPNNNNHISKENTCEICHNKCEEQYRICPDCFNQIQEGKLKKCQLCGKWYPADGICECIKKQG